MQWVNLIPVLIENSFNISFWAWLLVLQIKYNLITDLIYSVKKYRSIFIGRLNSPIETLIIRIYKKFITNLHPPCVCFTVNSWDNSLYRLFVLSILLRWRRTTKINNSRTKDFMPGMPKGSISVGKDDTNAFQYR